jgi:restriction-modification enzyme MmeI-like protein
MTPADFIAKWQASTRNERAACQEHFIDLCRLLDEPTPNTDPTGEDYAFEKGATKFTGEDGWADVWRRNRFAWEYKKKRGDLDAAYRQLLLYAGPLGNPPLLVVSDIARIVVRTNFTNAVTETHEIPLAELANPLRLRLLKWVFSDPEQLRPARTRQALTEHAAAEFAELARRLRVRGHDAQAVAHFVNRLVFCMFADDVGLLPAGLFKQMLAQAKRRPARSAEYAGQLFGAMAKSGGEVGFTAVPWFDGGLFEDAFALPLDDEDIDHLISVAKLDWAEIDPSILGTLFERGLDPDKRRGAHSTDRAKIEMLVDPVIHRPLQAEWQSVKAKIEAALAAPARGGRRARSGSGTAQSLYHEFLVLLRRFRVLDPAYGSGNFLYLSL